MAMRRLSGGEKVIEDGRWTPMTELLQFSDSFLPSVVVLKLSGP
jgi:hypothetical protein